MPLRLDQRKDPFAQPRIADQASVAGGQCQVALGQHHVHVGQQGAKERPLAVHPAQQREAFRPGLGRAVGQILLHRCAKAVPARQGEPALAPAETPRDGAQVFDALRRFARRRPGADVEFRDFANRRRIEKVFGEAWSLVHQRAVGGHAGLRQFFRCAQESLRRGFGWRQQAGFERCSDQGLQIASADLGIRVLGSDDLALFGHAQLAAHCAWGLREDRFIARAAATPHRAAPAVEHPQLDIV